MLFHVKCFDIQVWDREKIVIIPDHYIFTSDDRANRNVDILRDFCNEQNIKYFYDIKDLSNFKVFVEQNIKYFQCIYLGWTNKLLNRTKLENWAVLYSPIWLDL